MVVFFVVLRKEMSRIVDCHYLIELLDQCYTEQEVSCYFCMKEKFRACKRSLTAEEELRRKRFNFERKHTELWKISYYKKDPDNFVSDTVN